MAVLEISNLCKRFGDTTVLHNLSLTLNAGDRVGLVGANGVGKSTLVKIVAGEIEADSGFVRLQPGLRLGYLAQAQAAADGQSVQALLDAALGDLSAIAERMRSLEQTMAVRVNGLLSALLEEYALLSTRFESQGGYDSHQADDVMAGLGLAAIDRTRLVTSLSGGEKARLAIAALLLQAPDLLLLDEPTNHLDFAALAWLEQALAGWRGALLVVSHDRVFLDRSVNRIIEVDEESRGARTYPGNYTAWAAAKARERVQRRGEYEAQQEEIRALRKYIRSGGRPVAHNRGPTDNDGFYYNFKGGRVDATKARDLRASEERLRRLEAEGIPRPPPPVVIDSTLTPTQLGSRSPLSTADLRAGYGERTLFDEVSLTLDRRARVVLVGPNGAGKSTLLRL
ncbi:MAG: ATP-binding cassette domain-containing protein, partial [Caldilineaceae bacterium]